MIGNSVSPKPAVVLQLKDESGKTKSIRISVNILRNDLKKLRENKQEQITFRMDNYQRTMSIKELEEVILETSLYHTQQCVPIPRFLSKVLVYQYDRERLIYDEHIEGRNTELERLRTYLASKTKSNCILVGSDGVGKSTIVKELAQRILLNEDVGVLSGTAVIKIVLSEIPKFAPQKKVFYFALKNFIKENRDKIILHFDYLEDLSEHPDMESIFFEELIYRNTRIIGEVTVASIVNQFFSIDMLRFINFLPIAEPEVDEIRGLVVKQARRIEQENGIKISDDMIHFAIMTGLILSNETVANPELTVDVLNYAVMNAKINGAQEVTKKNILSFYNLNYKLIEKMEEREKMITAYHEIGHYVVSKMVKNVKRSKNAFVSILPVASALGITASYDDYGKQLTLTREYYLDQIACDYGGRTGEFLYTQAYSTGASADLESASEKAEMLVLSGGLAEDANFNNKSYMWGGTVKEYLLTDDEKKKLSEEIDKIRAEGFKRAQDICNENANLIAYLVEELLKDGILLGSELDELVKNFQGHEYEQLEIELEKE